MPAEKYTFKPTDSVRSFGEQMAHIGMSTQFILGVFIKGEELKFDPAETAKMEKQIGASKEECIETMEAAFDEVISTLGLSQQTLLQKKWMMRHYKVNLYFSFRRKSLSSLNKTNLFL